MATYKTINYNTPSTVYKPKEYNESEGAYANQIANANKLLQQQLANQPSAYQSLYQNNINNTINSIANRKPFTYDVNADALYNQYKDQFTALGKTAMADTVGQASALTGGYGNSYATTAGAQAYQNYLSQLNNIVPELYNSAYGRYKDEEQSLYNMLAMYQNQDAIDYGKYQDSYANWQNDRNYFAGELSTLRGLNQDAWAQNESNRYNANNLDWNNYYSAQNFNQAAYEQAVAEDQFNDQMKYNYDSLAAKYGGLDTKQVTTSSAENSDDVTYESSFHKTTGSYRYDDVGTKFTDAQFKGWQTQVGMNRGVEGRCEAIEDAYMEGKITAQQAKETLEMFGISEHQFAEIRGIS